MARFALGHRKIRELSGEFLETKRAPLGDRQRVRERLRIACEESRHLAGRLESVLRVGAQQRAGRIECGFVLHARQHVAQACVGPVDVRDAVGRDVRHLEALRERDQRVHERAVFGA